MGSSSVRTKLRVSLSLRSSVQAAQRVRSYVIVLGRDAAETLGFAMWLRKDSFDDRHAKLHHSPRSTLIRITHACASGHNHSHTYHSVFRGEPDPRVSSSTQQKQKTQEFSIFTPSMTPIPSIPIKLLGLGRIQVTVRVRRTRWVSWRSIGIGKGLIRTTETDGIRVMLTSVR